MNYEQYYIDISSSLGNLVLLRKAVRILLEEYSSFISTMPDYKESVEELVARRFKAKYTPEEAFEQLSGDFYFDKGHVEEILTEYRGEKTQAKAELVELGSKANLRAQVQKFEDLVAADEQRLFEVIPNEFETAIVEAAGEIQALGASKDEYDAALKANKFKLWYTPSLKPLHKAITKFENLKNKHGYLYAVQGDRKLSRPVNWMLEDDYYTVLKKYHLIMQKANPLSNILSGNEHSLNELKKQYNRYCELTAKLANLESNLYEAFMTHVDAFMQHKELRAVLNVNREIAMQESAKTTKQVAEHIHKRLLTISLISEHAINLLSAHKLKAKKGAAKMPETELQVFAARPSEQIQSVINFKDISYDFYSFYVRPIAWAKERLGTLQNLYQTNQATSPNAVIKSLFVLTNYDVPNAGGIYFYPDQVCTEVTQEDLVPPEMKFLDDIASAVYFPHSCEALFTVKHSERHQYMIGSVGRIVSKPNQSSSRPANDDITPEYSSGNCGSSSTD